MKLALAFTVYATASGAIGLCSYAEQALKTPEHMRRHLKKQDAAKENAPKEKRQSGPGNIPFTTFNENQVIDVTGQHVWVAPGPSDIRGPCPGLDALANHGYFPHNGVVPLAIGASATEQVYGLAPKYGIPLTVYATLVDGDMANYNDGFAVEFLGAVVGQA